MLCDRSVDDTRDMGTAAGREFEWYELLCA